MTRLLRVLSEFADWFYPRLEGDLGAHASNEATKRSERLREVALRVEDLGSDEDRLVEHLAAMEALAEKENARKGSVDTRLISIVGLLSVAATVALTGMLALASRALPFDDDTVRLVLTVGCFYLLLQLFAAFQAAVGGLRSAGYTVTTASSVLPERGRTRAVFLRDRITTEAEALEDNRERNNRKVDALNVSYTAIRNFLAGLLFVGCCALTSTILLTGHSREDRCADPQRSSCLGAGNTPIAAAPSGRAASQSAPTAIDAGELRYPILSVLFGVAMGAAGLVLLITASSAEKRSVGAALTAGGVALSLLGGAKIELFSVKLDKLIGSIELHLFEPERPVLAAASSHVLLARLVTVGPFPDGDHELNSTQIAKCISDAVEAETQIQIRGWQIVGRVDKRQLRPDRVAVYGSNQGLAMARAAWVRDSVMSNVKTFNSANAVVSVGGAKSIGPKVGEPDLQSDRAVDIFVLAESPADSKAWPPSLMPISCGR
jgi:hypothetical protein